MVTSKQLFLGAVLGSSTKVVVFTVPILQRYIIRNVSIYNTNPSAPAAVYFGIPESGTDKYLWAEPFLPPNESRLIDPWLAVEPQQEFFFWADKNIHVAVSGYALTL